jgi:TetR/AcrR family transcriptional repressor of mexJK operon
MVALEKKRAGGRPPAHEVEERRNHLITVATKLFLSHGYEATSMETIARMAGASKTTIYRNFGDKTDLFRTIFIGFVEPIWPTLADLAIDGRPPREVLTDFARQMVSPSLINAESIALLRLVYRESPRFPELARIFTEAEHTTVGVLARYLTQSCRQGVLRLADPDWAASQFIEMVWGTVSRRMVIGTSLLPDQSERERIVGAAVSLFLDGALPGDTRHDGETPTSGGLSHDRDPDHLEEHLRLSRRHSVGQASG